MGCDTCRWFVPDNPPQSGDCWRYPTIVDRPASTIARGCGEYQMTDAEYHRRTAVKRRETTTVSPDT